MANPGVPFRNFKVGLKADAFIYNQTRKEGLQVINKTGSDIAANKLVAITGFDVTSKRVKVVLADADVAAHDDIYVTKTAITNGAKGHVFKGFVSPATLNTNGVTTAGDPVYLDATTAGGFTATAPTAANATVIPVGFAIVKSATVGQIFWQIGPIRKSGSNQFQTSSGAVASNVLQTATGTISSANITGTSAGQLGHTQGVVLVAAQGVGTIVELVDAMVSLHFGVTAYTGGGNTTINISGGGAAVSGLVSNANLVTGSANKIAVFPELSAAAINYTDNNGLALVSASAPTNPGTATGTLTYQIIYRVITW